MGLSSMVGLRFSFLAKAFPGVYVFLIWRLAGSAFMCNFLSFILAKATEGSCLNAISLKDTRWYYVTTSLFITRRSSKVSH